MNHNVTLFLNELAMLWTSMGMYYVAFALFFVILSKGNKCNESLQYWKKNNVIVDLCYWFIVPIFGKYIKILLLTMGATYLYGLHSVEEQNAYFQHGFGVFGGLPMLVQVVLLLVFSDILLYWIHRAFHSAALWRVHAVHHSSKDLDWSSGPRFHPLNIWGAFTLVDVIMFMLGFSPEAMIFLAPFNTFYSAFVHANLNWKLGWLGYVLASPVFHRWHHTSIHEGGSKNFAPTFPVLDMMFGTYYMPSDKLPADYGVSDENFPHDDFVAQIFYPFRKN